MASIHTLVIGVGTIGEVIDDAGRAYNETQEQYKGVCKRIYMKGQVERSLL